MEIEVHGHLSRLIGGDLFPQRSYQLESYVAEGMTAFDCPGLAVGIVAGDKLVYAKGFGVQKRRRASRHPHRLPDQFGDQGLSCHNARDRRRSRQVPLGAVALVS